MYWRKVLRMAALCHDIGHLPFSHAAEHEVLPENMTHETITYSLVMSGEMSSIWGRMTPSPNAEHIAKLAVGREKFPDPTVHFSDWEAILSEITVGDAFGVDRMDYLLRDSLHAGVQYGKFDHHRLVDTLRILPKSEHSAEPALGLEMGDYIRQKPC
jgi:HD superfamily phosphohydrolase